LFTLQGNTYYKNKIKSFIGYALTKMHQLVGLAIHTPKDKNKIYSLHEPDVYVIAKGKDHKQYEYGNKVSIVSTKDTNIIVNTLESTSFHEF
jgi:hypothetical protein